jgi:hypothetical protein
MVNLSPLLEETITFWWLLAQKAVTKSSSKGFDTLVWLVA